MSENGTLSNAMQERAEITVSFLKSLSHPARLVLLCRLSEGQATVGELEACIDRPQPEVSKHLARLRAEGLVVASRRGRFIDYALAEERTARVVRLLYREFCEIGALD